MPPTWQDTNQQYLAIALDRVRVALQHHIAPEQEKSGALPLPPLLDVDPSTVPALQTLCSVFHLSPFERDLLLLCAGGELSSSLAQLCATAQGGSHVAYPTFSLALAVLPDPDWSAITPVSPLRYWRLIEVSSGDSLTQSRLRIDERVLHYLNGVSYLDDRLRGLVEPYAVQTALPASQEQLVQQIVERYARMMKGRPPLIQLWGEEREGKGAIATAACYHLGLQLHTLRVADLPTAAAEREALARLWEREALLSRSALLVDCEEGDRTPALLAFLESLPCPVLVATRDPLTLRRPNLRLEVQKPTLVEQRELWQMVLDDRFPTLNGHLEPLVAQFNLSAAAIETIGASVAAETPIHQASASTPSQATPEPAIATLWNACRTHARTRLDDLAQRIPAIATWDDLVLPDTQRQTLREIVAQVRQRTTVYETWGIALRGANGLGISALFAGASGTGKTMAAEVLAQTLQLDLYRIDLSQVVSKYIGETEKNLRRVFEAAEMGGAILLFDEADALFGKRSEVKDSHDRYANIEVSYLLQRMEAYRGLAILTTNLRQAIDQAFLRRIRFVVQFPFPDREQRREIWQRIFPPKLPTEGLHLDRLAQLNIAGGNIRNIALNAAFLAADAGEVVRMDHLLQATRSEYMKLEKTLTDAEIGGWI